MTDTTREPRTPRADDPEIIRQAAAVARPGTLAEGILVTAALAHAEALEAAPPPAKALRAALDEAERLLAEAAPRMVVGDRRASEWYVLLREWQDALAALPAPAHPRLRWTWSGSCEPSC